MCCNNIATGVVPTVPSEARMLLPKPSDHIGPPCVTQLEAAFCEIPGPSRLGSLDQSLQPCTRLLPTRALVSRRIGTCGQGHRVGIQPIIPSAEDGTLVRKGMGRHVAKSFAGNALSMYGFETPCLGRSTLQMPAQGDRGAAGIPGPPQAEPFVSGCTHMQDLHLNKKPEKHCAEAGMTRLREASHPTPPEWSPDDSQHHMKQNPGTLEILRGSRNDEAWEAQAALLLRRRRPPSPPARSAAAAVASQQQRRCQVETHPHLHRCRHPVVRDLGPPMRCGALKTVPHASTML